jgi:hypothetical protein
MAVVRSIEFPKELINEVEVQEDGQTVIYRARAFNIFMTGLDVRGGVSIAKIVRTTEMRPKRERGFLFHKTMGLAPVSMDKVLWEVCSDRCDSSLYFVSFGKSVAFECSAYFGDWLKGKAATQNIVLPKALILEIFRPIREKLFEIHLLIKAA